MTNDEEALYRQLEAMSGAPVVELAGGEPELTDAQVEAIIEAMVRDDEQERLFSQLENLGR